jgi:hypothetical protein
MADVYGVNATGALNTTPAQKVEVSSWGGRLRVLNDSYEASAAAAGTDVIVGRLTASQVLQPDSFVQFDALGVGVTLDIALRPTDGTTATVIIAGVDASSAGVIDFRAVANIGDMPETVATESDLIIQIQDAAATGTIVSQFRYTID